MKGDVVTLFDGYRVRNVAHFSRLVGDTPTGRAVKMTIVRSRKTHELSLSFPLCSRFAAALNHLPLVTIRARL